MFFHFKVSSKDGQVLKKFLRFLHKLKISTTVLKHFSKQKKRKFITVLKSPHVNKTAQEQFEFKYHSKEFLVDSLKPLTFFLTIKKIQNFSFPGLKLEVKGLVHLDKKSKSFLRLLNPDNVVLEDYSNKTLKQLSPPTKKYIQLFDCYGELYLKELFLNQVNIYDE